MHLHQLGDSFTSASLQCTSFTVYRKHFIPGEHPRLVVVGVADGLVSLDRHGNRQENAECKA